MIKKAFLILAYMPLFILNMLGCQDLSSFCIDDKDVIQLRDGNYIKSEQIRFNKLDSIYEECLSKSVPTSKLIDRNMKRDEQLVNEFASSKGYKELPAEAIDFLKKENNWQKVVDYVKNSKNLDKLDYKVVFFSDSLAIVPKDCNVEVKK